MDMPVNRNRQGPAAHWRTAVRPEWLIDAWMELLPIQQAQTMRQVHDAVLAASSAIVPCVKWGNLLYLRAGKPVAHLTPHRQAAVLQLVAPRPARPRKLGPLAGSFRFRHSQPVDTDQVTCEVVGVLRLMTR